MNELKGKRFQQVTQTFTYLPHFISIVVVCGIIKDFVRTEGIVTSLYSVLTATAPRNLLGMANLFVPIYVLTDIWQGIGWGSIIYLAALSGIDQELYEAAKIDGANKWKQLTTVTLPGIAPTIIIMLILKIGSLMSLGFEKIILLYSPAIYATSDVISTYVYRLGIDGQQWSYTTAIGLFNSVINVGLLITANFISNRFSDTSLW